MDFSNEGTGKCDFPVLHFQWLAVIENGGTFLYRIQAIEKCHFSMAC